MSTAQLPQDAGYAYLWLYSLRTALIASVPSLIGVCVALISTFLSDMDRGAIMVKLPMPDLWDLFGNIVFAPLTETATLVIGLLVLGNTMMTIKETSLICGLAFGILHGVLQGWIKFPVAAWGFYFFATAFQVWKPTSMAKAVLAALTPHVIINTSAMAVLAAYSI
jgi:hypothetical protein